MKKYVQASDNSVNWYLKVFRPSSKEYQCLETLATLLNFATDSNDYFVDTIYYDYGQNWMFTTISKADSTFGGVQILNDKLQEKALAVRSIDDIANVAKEVLNK